MLKRLSKYPIFQLIIKASRYKRTNTAGQVDDSSSAKYFNNILFFSLSVCIVLIGKVCFSESFYSITSNILAIFIGLFTTSLIFSLDKFYIPKNNKRKDYDVILRDKKEGAEQKDLTMSFLDISELDSQEKLKDIQSYNLTLKFSYMTGFNILLCIIALFLILVSTISNEYFNVSINLSDFTFVFQNLKMDDIKLFVQIVLVTSYRVILLYLLIKILFTTMFIVSKMVDYMTSKIQ